MLHNVSGIDPISLLGPKTRIDIDNQFPNVEGMDPVNLLEEKVTDCNGIIFP